jgi:hypothetical protein
VDSECLVWSWNMVGKILQRAEPGKMLFQETETVLATSYRVLEFFMIVCKDSFSVC